MDFVSRHASSGDHHGHPSSNDLASSPSSSSSSAPPEELEYLARYMVVKHSWRGRYKRILCISNFAIITLDPSTLSVTNSYDVGNDYEGAAPVLGRDDNSQEFTINVRSDGRGKFKGIKFSSRFRANILTELHRIKWSQLSVVTEYPVLHLRRRTSEWAPFVSFLLNCGCCTAQHMQHNLLKGIWPVYRAPFFDAGAMICYAFMKYLKRVGASSWDDCISLYTNSFCGDDQFHAEQ